MYFAYLQALKKVNTPDNTGDFYKRGNIMKFKMIKAALAGLVLGVSGFANATIIWDQGPSTGDFGGSWNNYTISQNFADNVMFTSDTLVTGLNYFTDFDLSSQTGSSAFNLHIYNDASGAPSTLFHQENLGFSASVLNAGTTLNGTSVNMLEFNFSGLNFLMNTTYWVGLSGNGFGAGQVSLSGTFPQDGQIARFSGDTFSTMATVGDQMFQLTSAAEVPEPSTLAILALGLIGLGARRFRK